MVGGVDLYGWFDLGVIVDVDFGYVEDYVVVVEEYIVV